MLFYLGSFEDTAISKKHESRITFSDYILKYSHILACVR
jgi:hypothetical protein